MNAITRNPNKLRRHLQAVERQEARDRLTPAQQLRVLDERLGPQEGAKKERARLGHQIQESYLN